MIHLDFSFSLLLYPNTDYFLHHCNYVCIMNLLSHTATKLVVVTLIIKVINSLGFVPSDQPFQHNKYHGDFTTKLYASSQPLPPKLKVAIVGAGPAGLLLSHLLLKQENIHVSLLESRSDPRLQDETEQRAYALGLGIRGRTAIREVDEDLWKTVKDFGFESERFQLHISRFIIPLRSERDSKKRTLTADGEEEKFEPSLLLFQSSLCAAMIEELERRHGKSNNLKVAFNQKVDKCDLESMCVNIEDTSNPIGPFDVVFGCDGVNSSVRKAMQETSSSFQTEKEELPGIFKVARLERVPSKVDPAAVSLILPKSGSTGAFIEPTGTDGSCCVLLSGKIDNPILANTNNATALRENLQEAFPDWEGESLDSITEQLMAQTKPGFASSVTCNKYHFKGKAALLGDAAHATGGVSGQGVNSALMDSVVLAKSIQENRDNIQQALLTYSKLQVPEGKALYDLSFGPKPKGFKGIQWALLNARDAIFRGRWGIGQPPLQTRLTTNLKSFSEIRRERDGFYPEPFPSATEFEQMLEKISQD